MGFLRDAKPAKVSEVRNDNALGALHQFLQHLMRGLWETRAPKLGHNGQHIAIMAIMRSLTPGWGNQNRGSHETLYLNFLLKGTKGQPPVPQLTGNFKRPIEDICP